MILRLLACLLCIGLALCACSGGEDANDTSSAPTAPSVESVATWSKFDLDDAWNSSAPRIKVDGKTLSGAVDGISLAGDVLSVTAAGTYVLSGSLTGQLVIDVPDTEKVTLVLDGFSVTCSDRSPIYCEQADKLKLLLASGSENRVSDTDSGYVEGMSTGEGRYAGAIHSKCPLTVIGEGSLLVESTYRHGIVSKNLRIVSGTVSVNAADDGLKGKNDLAIRGGKITVKAGGNGLKVTEEKDEEHGTLVIEGGTLSVTAGKDGFDATRNLQILGGDLTAKAGDDALSCGGSVSIDGDTTLTLQASAEGKGIKADGDVTVCNGSVTVTRSFEGIESKNASVTIAGGTHELHASDDGINAEKKITVSGGYTFVQAAGDGLDSNGDLLITGGTLIVQGPTSNGDSPLDCGDRNATLHISGGTVLAYGSAGMLKYPDSADGAQCALVYVGTLEKDTVYSLRDSDGNAVYTFTLQQAAQSVTFSSDQLKTGKTYTLYSGAKPQGESKNGIYSDPTSTGGTECYTFTVSETVSSNRQEPGFPGGPGGMPGGGPGGFPGGEHPDRPGDPGERPDRPRP